MSIHRKPTVRQIQPMAFSGRLEATRAPTRGKTRKRPPPKGAPTERSAPRLPGTCAARRRKQSTKLATNMTKESPPSDQASHAEVRVLIALTPLPCSLDLRSRHHSTIRPSPKRYEGLSQDFLWIASHIVCCPHPR